MIELYRYQPPSAPGDAIGEDAAGHVLTVSPHGVVMASGVDVGAADVLEAFERACREAFGYHWQDGFSAVTGIKRPRRSFSRDGGQIPPRILKWVAWLQSFDNPRTVGLAMEARAAGADNLPAEIVKMAISEIA